MRNLHNIYEPGDEVRLTDETVALGFDREATIVAVCPIQTDGYTVRFPDGLLRRVNTAQIYGRIYARAGERIDQ